MFDNLGGIDFSVYDTTQPATVYDFGATTADVTGADNSWGGFFDSISETLQGATRVAVNAWAASELADTFGTVDPATGQVYTQGERAQVQNGWLMPALVVGGLVYLLTRG